MASRIGIFAGTFDPVHNGHTAFAEAAIKLCNLDKVVFLPERVPRSKQHVTPIAQRIAMLRAAGLEVLDLPQAQFTVAATLPELQKHFPDAKLVMLFGADVAQHIQSWPDAGLLQTGTELAIGFREGHHLPKGLTATVIPTKHAHVTASHVRQGTSYETAPAVQDYIKKHNLYTV